MQVKPQKLFQPNFQQYLSLCHQKALTNIFWSEHNCFLDYAHGIMDFGLYSLCPSTQKPWPLKSLENSLFSHSATPTLSLFTFCILNTYAHLRLYIFHCFLLVSAESRFDAISLSAHFIFVTVCYHFSFIHPLWDGYFYKSLGISLSPFILDIFHLYTQTGSWQTQLLV